MSQTKKLWNGEFIFLMLLLGIAARWMLFDIQSGDYVSFLLPWIEEARGAGGWAYVAIDPLRSQASSFNYSPMYQYIICALSMIRLEIPELYLIKIVSVVFDLLCAIAAYGIVYEASEKDTRKATLAFGVTLALPTVMLNSAAWAQADAIYSFFLLLSLWMLLKGKHFLTWLFFGLSLTFKLQALFFLPFLMIAWLLKKTKLRYMFVPVILLCVSMLPAYLLGRPLYSLIEVYTAQVNLYKQLSMNYPNIYTVIPDVINGTLQDQLIRTGVVVTMMLLVMLAYVIYTKTFTVTKQFLLALAVFSMELVVFTLPVMHERYGFAAGLLAMLYGLFGKRRFGIAVGIEALSLATYARFLFSSTVIKLYPLAAVLLLLLLFMAADLWDQMQRNEPEDTSEEEDYFSDAAAAGVPRVSDVQKALSQGKQLRLKRQAGDVRERERRQHMPPYEPLEETPPEIEEEIASEISMTQEVVSDAGTDRDRVQPEQEENAAYHAPTMEELFGKEYATDK